MWYQIRRFADLDPVQIDGWAFRLHYWVTSTGIFAASAVAFAKQYFGDPIECIFVSIINNAMSEKIWTCPLLVITYIHNRMEWSCGELFSRFFSRFLPTMSIFANSRQNRNTAIHCCCTKGLHISLKVFVEWFKIEKFLNP